MYKNEFITGPLSVTVYYIYHNVYKNNNIKIRYTEYEFRTTHVQWNMRLFPLG